MARELRSRCFVVLLLLCLSIVLSQSEARHLKVATSFKKMEYSITKLAPRGIKQSGPSPGGPGHRSGNAQLLGPTKHSEILIFVRLDAACFSYISAEVNS
ncbi:hypothetical protein NC651_022530 [Populus alba x Populus x berolinensis]|nr:hypothetical protein NC651_022530 [Populus alba x Populus x berolinensis]